MSARRFALAVALLAAAAGTARAGGFALAEQSATAGGTAGAGTARAGDAGAAWYNPAALADGGGWRLGLGILAARPSLSARAADGSWETSNEAAWSTPPHLDASYAWDEWAVGLSAGVPYGSGVAWPADWPGRYEIVRTQLEDFRLAPFVAWRSGRLRLAGGVHLDATRLRVHRKLDFIDTEGEVFLDLAGQGIGVDLALHYVAGPSLDLGLTYKSRTSIDLDGGADFTAPDAFSEKTADQHARTELTLPDRIALGARWHRGEWTALADLELTMWQVYDQLVIDFENDATPDAVQTYDWRPTVAVRAGAELRPRRNLVLRGGAFYDPSPAEPDTLAPSSPDSPRIGATVGATRTLGRAWSVDIFYEYMQLLGRSAENEEALSASYGGHAHLIGIGLRWQR